MNDKSRPGYYRDAEGHWQVDRRSGEDRRLTAGTGKHGHDMRKTFRRLVDRELLERDHKIMIVEALEEFADTHEGHL